MPKTKNKFKSNLWGERPSNFVVDLKEQLIEEEKIKEKKAKSHGIEDFYEKLEEIDVRQHIKKGKERAENVIMKSVKAIKVAGSKINEPINKLKKLNPTIGIKLAIKKYLKIRKEKIIKIKRNKKKPLKIQKERIKKLAQTKIDKNKVKKTVSTIVKNSQLHVAQNDTKLAPKYLFLFSSFLPSAKNWHLIYRERLNNLAVFSVFKFLFFIFKPVFLIIYKACFRVGWIIVFLIRLIYFSGIAIGSAISSAAKFIVNFSKKIFVKRDTGEVVLAENNEEAEIHDYSVINAVTMGDEYTDEQNIRDYETKKGQRKLMPQFSLKKLKPTLIFAGLLLLFIIPFKAFTYYQSLDINNLKGKVLGISEEAVNSLMSAGQFAGEMDFKGAQENFSQAADKFLKAQNELSGISNVLLKLASITTNEDLKFASESKNILSAGEQAAELGNNLSLAINSLLGNEKEEKSIGSVMENFIKFAEVAVTNAENLELILGRINYENLPEEYRREFISSREKAIFLGESLEEFVDLMRGGRTFFGVGDYKRYLLVFQNNAEMRATGGFIGSYALVDFTDGKMTNIEVPEGGSYDTEGGLNEMVVAPEPLHLVSPLWHFWDANWWPDWPTSARKLMWFYEKSGGPTVDGVISFTPTVLERVLKAIGPIDMTEKYGVIISADNFQETTRAIIDESNEKFINSNASSTIASTEKPKTIIGDLTKKIIEELPLRLNKETLIKIMKTMEENLNEKHILFYFNDSETQSKVEEYGWDGKIKHTARDYLSVINTNIAGGKSDRKIKEIINHEAEVQDDGSVINTVKIERTHTGLKFVDASGVRNVNWMRIYVPLGSKLIEVSGFEKPDEIYFEKPDESWLKDPDLIKTEENTRIDEKSGTKIYEEAGKTVFANWSMIDPGQTVTIYIKYSLPFKFTETKAYTVLEKIEEALNPEQKELHTYALLVQKQSGSMYSEITSRLILPQSMNILWSYPDNLDVRENGWMINEKLNVDKYWATIITK